MSNRPARARSIGLRSWHIIAATQFVIACGGMDEQAADPEGAAGATATPGNIIPGADVPAGVMPKATATTEYYDDAFPRYTVSKTTHFCVLTGIKGNYSHEHAEFGLSVDDTWFLWRQYADNHGWVTCTSMNNFVGNPGYERLLGARSWVAGSTSYVAGDSANMWWGDAASFISRVGGHWEGGGEYVKIRQSANAYASSVITLQSRQSDGSEATGYSFFVGVPGEGRLVRLWGYNTAGAVTRGTVASSGTFEMVVGTTSGYSSYWLAPIDNGICYLTYFSGNFDGGAEEVRIFKEAGRWVLHAKSNSNKYIRAAARCMDYNQRT
jgi:hypothetical protein